MDILDAEITYWFLAIQKSGPVYEGNPVMAWLIAQGWGWFFLTKAVAPLFALGILWWNRHFKPAQVIAWGLFGLYGLLMLWHLWCMFLLKG